MTVRRAVSWFVLLPSLVAVAVLLFLFVYFPTVLYPQTAQPALGNRYALAHAMKRCGESLGVFSNCTPSVLVELDASLRSTLTRGCDVDAGACILAADATSFTVASSRRADDSGAIVRYTHTRASDGFVTKACAPRHKDICRSTEPRCSGTSGIELACDNAAYAPRTPTR